MYLGAPAARAPLDEVEVEHEVEGGDRHDDQAEEDADGPGIVDEADLTAEEVGHEADHVDEEHGPGGGDHTEAEVLRDPDHAGGVDDEQKEEDPDGEPNRLEHDPVVAELVDVGDRPQDKALDHGVERGGETGQRRLEHRDEGHDEPPEHRQEQPAGHLHRLGDDVDLRPAEPTGHQQHDQEDGRRGDHAVDRHRVGGRRRRPRRDGVVDRRAAGGLPLAVEDLVVEGGVPSPHEATVRPGAGRLPGNSDRWRQIGALGA